MGSTSRAHSWPASIAGRTIRPFFATPIPTWLSGSWRGRRHSAPGHDGAGACSLRRVGADPADAGVVVAAGHTAATFEQARAAIEAGATLLTHTFNGMPGVHHRAPGPVLAFVENPGGWLEVINDGVHVRPEVIRMLCQLAPGRVALVSDAMAAAGVGDGRYRLGNVDVDVAEGVARLTRESRSPAQPSLWMSRSPALYRTWA